MTLPGSRRSDVVRYSQRAGCTYSSHRQDQFLESSTRVSWIHLWSSRSSSDHELVQRKYHWTSLKSDVQDYVLSCGRRRIKRSTSQRVAMLPARFLKTWEVLQMKIHDMGARSEAGNKHLPVVVDRASKFLFAYPLPNKTAENVATKLLELLLTSRQPPSLYAAAQARSSPQTVSNASVNDSM